MATLPAGDDPDRYGIEQWRGWWSSATTSSATSPPCAKSNSCAGTAGAPWFGGEEDFSADPFAPIDEIAQLTCDDDRWSGRIRRFDHDDELNPRNTLVHAHYPREHLPAAW